MGREYRINLAYLDNHYTQQGMGERLTIDQRLHESLQLAIAERLEALVEVMEEKLTQIAQNLAK